jgi:L-rhamnose mutarotase
MMRRCLILDLKDDPALISEYERHHLPGNVWPSVTASLQAAGIEGMEIYRYGSRLVMIMETSDRFDPEEKARSDAANPEIIAWEELMDTFQQRVDGPPDAKWRAAHLIFTYGLATAT